MEEWWTAKPSRSKDDSWVSSAIEEDLKLMEELLNKVANEVIPDQQEDIPINTFIFDDVKNLGIF